MSDPRAFLKIDRIEIPRRAANERLQDWNEVDVVPEKPLAQEQSSRCMECGVPFCQSDFGCPLYNQIPEWNLLVSQERWEEASIRLHATNNFPEFTGRLCPAPCESACVLGVSEKPVNIKGTEWSIADLAFERGWIQPQKMVVHQKSSVAIVGSGPAGLTVAQQLTRLGYAVTVFEKADRVGGLLRYGIPDFKLEKSVLDRRLWQLQQEGVQFKTKAELGRDYTLLDLKNNFSAVVLATGAEQPRDLKIQGRNSKGIHFAMDYLFAQNQSLLGHSLPAELNAHGKQVVILGGGDTGSDCLGTALRQGASKVLQFEIQPKPPEERSSQTPWPLWPMKLKASHAHEEGGWRHWSLVTEEFIVENEIVKQLRVRRTDPLGTHDSLFFDVDMVILALGFTGISNHLKKSLPQIDLTERGTILTNPQFMTSVAGVFACGDSRRGASLIVWAIAEGRRLADSVHQYFLKGDHSNAISLSKF